MSNHLLSTMNLQAKPSEPAPAQPASKAGVEVVVSMAGAALLLIAVPWLLFLTGPVGRHNWLNIEPLRALGIAGDSRAIEVAPILLGAGIAALVAYLMGVFDRDAPPLVLAAFGVLLVIALIGDFSALYLQAAHDHTSGASACFGPVAGPNGEHPPVVHQWDALYFSVGVLTTAGTGSLQPLSRSCRELATAQMLLDFTLLTVAVTVLISRLAADLIKSQVQRPGD
jgi:uncharacterized membrane protein